MPIFHAIVLGIVQGLSEYLPISSSGHLILVPWIFKWDDFGGDIALEKAFDVALHLGTLAGALVFFRKDIVRYAKAGLSPSQRGTTDFRLAWMLLLSAVPAAITGALFKDTIEAHTSSIPQIAIMLIVFGLVLGWADSRPGTRSFEQTTRRDAAAMGLAQALALQPGVSRSGVTMSAGRFMGLGREGVARFAFLMSLPITAGAIVFTAADVQSTGGLPEGFAAPFIWGVIASGITGWFAIWGLFKLIKTHSFKPFVIYRIGMGTFVLALYAYRY